jgi:hypothetical protein
MTTLTYIRAGDYLLPNIILCETGQNIKPLGKYGMMHKEYLRREKPSLYASLLLSERLYPVCREIDQAAAHRLATIENRDTAHEAVLYELVFC